MSTVICKNFDNSSNICYDSKHPKWLYVFIFSIILNLIIFLLLMASLTLNAIA
jgi:uncharacterized BrkB/YihY/UPF0761 family membrane protein